MRGKDIFARTAGLGHTQAKCYHTSKDQEAVRETPSTVQANTQVQQEWHMVAFPQRRKISFKKRVLS